MSPPGSARPNVLWIFADELRADALGCYGGGIGPVHTPNIDRLATTGTLFPQPVLQFSGVRPVEDLHPHGDAPAGERRALE